MNFIYEEYYFTNRQYSILLKIEYSNENFFRNLIISKNEIKFLNIETEVFDILSFESIEYIKSIFDKTNAEYLNNKHWKDYIENHYKQFLADNNILRNKRYITNLNPTGIVGNEKKLSTIKSYTFNINFDSNQEIIMALEFENKFYSEIDFIHKLFDIIFSRNYTLNLKLCSNCKKFFFAQPGNKHNCSRIYIGDVTCSKYSDAIRRQYSKDNPIKELKRKINGLYSKNEVILKKFQEENREYKKTYYGDKKNYVLFLLSYINEENREKVINDLGLQKYLD